MAVQYGALEVGPVHAVDGEHEADEAMLEEGRLEQPAHEHRRVVVAEEEAREDRERHYEERAKYHSVLK